MKPVDMTKTHRLNDYLEDLREQSGPCLTVALACDEGGKNNYLHRQHFGNVLRKLSKSGEVDTFSIAEVDSLFEKAQALTEDEERWSGSYEGVCIHVTDKMARLIKLQYPPVEIATVSRSLKIRPVADALASETACLALHLSLKSPRLFRFDGVQTRLDEQVELPESIYSYSESEVVDGGQQARMARASRGGGDSQLVNQGMSPAESARDLNEPVFFREIAHALAKVDGVIDLPLVIVGDAQVVSEFLKVYLHSEGSVEKVTDAGSHPTVKEIGDICSQYVWRKQQSEKRAVLATLSENQGRDEMFSDNVREIYSAAQQGRISSCVVACDGDVFMRIGEDGLPHPAKPEDPDSFDALDRIYSETLLKEGTAIVLPMENIPGGKSAAAILKW